MDMSPQTIPDRRMFDVEHLVEQDAFDREGWDVLVVVDLADRDHMSRTVG